MTDKFSDLKKVKYIIEKFKFYERHELHEELNERFKKFKDYIQMIEEGTELAKKEGATDHMINNHL